MLVDTGALYRTITPRPHGTGPLLDETDGVGELAEKLAESGAVRLESSADGVARVTLEGEDFSGFIRTPEISQGASKVSAIPRVRAALLEMQRAAGSVGGVVLEGRDIGSVVFPEAEVKVFLTATTRALRPRFFGGIDGDG